MAPVSAYSDYAVVYDISCDRERARVDKALKGFGFRIQKSVFECRLSRRDRERLVSRLNEMNIQSGFVKIYRLEYSFTGKIIGAAVEQSPDEGNAFVV